MLYDFEHQVLIGTILGGSSLVKPSRGKNYYLSMRSKNDTWLLYKMAEMPTLFEGQKLHQYGNTFRCNSKSSEMLGEMQDNLYQNGKRFIAMNILDCLVDTALAIWFLDGGSKTGRAKKNAYINTTKFQPGGSEIIQRYFNEVGMPCGINRDGSRLKILFTVEGTQQLLKIISHRVPLFMLDRL